LRWMLLPFATARTAIWNESMTGTETIHPHDRNLPASVVRKRRRFRRIGVVLILIAVFTAAPGWSIYGVAIWSVFSLRHFTFIQALLAYGLLIISSVSLVLGLWYLLLAQARRMSRMVEGDSDGLALAAKPLCSNCGWPRDYPDRFCRHCGKPLANVSKADGGQATSGPRLPDHNGD
jgi:hypothetical protein